MGVKALKFAAAVLLCAIFQPAFLPASSSAQPPAQSAESNVVPNRITGYTAWDDAYLYIAIQVTKPVLAGINKEPFSNPLDDDAVVVYLQTDGDHKATSRTAHTVSIAVSEAGGTQIYSGEKSTPLFSSLKDLTTQLQEIDKNEKDPNRQQARRVELLSKIPKIQVTPGGALHPGAGNFPGYTLEMAVPWADLGGQPALGAKLGFNIAALSKENSSPKVQSLVPDVHGLSDLEDPSHWGELTLAGDAKTGSPRELTCPRVISNKPTIDGVFAEGEWNNLAEFAFGEITAAPVVHGSLASTIAARSRAEFTPRPPQPVVVNSKPAESRPAVQPHSPYKVGHLVFAQYEYDYQGDPRKEVPAALVTNADHSSALAHHPLEGAGPWFSYDRADWERGQLAELRKDGIDVVLPVYRADPAHRKAYADKGLLVLVSALTYLRRAGLDYPQVGMCLDTQSLVEMAGDRLDAKDTASQALVYRAIRDFYLRIPPEYRSCVALNPADGAHTAYPVFLSDSAAFKQWDAGFTAGIRGRFRADFNGADLIIVGPAGFGANSGIDSCFSSAEADAQQGSGWIKTVSVRAGFDLDAARNFIADTSALPPRRDGATYRGEWLSAIEKHADWILVQSWNDFSLGGEVAPSMEAGYSTADLTRVYTHLFNGTDKRVRAKFVWNDAPRTAAAGSKFAVQVRIQNAGAEAWGTAREQSAVSVEYRWIKSGLVLGGKQSGSTAGSVLSGSETTVALRVDTSPRGAGLAPGDYTLEIGVSSGKNGAVDWSPENGDVVQIPVTLTAPDAGPGTVAVVDSDLPGMMEAGGVYPVSARLRNDSSAAWKAAGSRVTARIYRLDETPSGLVRTPVESADASAQLARDVPPGEETTVQVLLPITDPDGKPLPDWAPDSPFCYAICWEVAQQGSGITVAAAHSGANQVPGFVSTPAMVGITEFDFGVRFTQDGTLATLPGERRLPVILGVKNTGPQTWKRDSVRIGYHWYYQDGSEFVWEDETTALPHDLPPGEGVNNLLTYVTAPPCDGNYFLVWDVKFGDTWASTSEATHVFDEQVHPVQVSGGRLVFVDLAKSYNLDGVTELNSVKGADFDGKGDTFPAALIPPFTDDGIVAAGLWQPYERTGPESPRHISFRWGSKEPRSENFIVCKGQRVELGKYTGKCRVVHIVAASVNANITTNIKLVFQEPSGESEDLYAFSVSRWDQPPVNGEAPVFTCKRHHTAAGSQDGVVSLYHYSFVISDPRRIAALKLPNEPNIRIAAVTLEQ